jgi:hypothetical protein
VFKECQEARCRVLGRNWKERKEWNPVGLWKPGKGPREAKEPGVDWRWRRVIHHKVLIETYNEIVSAGYWKTREGRKGPSGDQARGCSNDAGV